MNKLVGIGGHLGAGKDVVADYLVEDHGWVKLGMSDILNRMMLLLNPYIPTEGGLVRYQDIHAERGYVDAKTHPEVRRLLQTFGTEIGRDMIDENLWVNLTAARIQDLRKDFNVVVTGIRFPNELEMVHRLGGDTWWVERPDKFREHTINAHSSENSVDEVEFSLTLLNDSTIPKLLLDVDDLL